MLLPRETVSLILSVFDEMRLVVEVFLQVDSLKCIVDAHSNYLVGLVLTDSKPILRQFHWECGLLPCLSKDIRFHASPLYSGTN